MYKPSIIIPPSSHLFVQAMDNAHLARLADTVCGHFEDGQIIPAENDGSGFIRSLSPCPGLELQFWNLSYKKVHSFNSVSFREKQQNFYSIIYSLTPDLFQLRRNGHSRAIPEVIISSADQDFNIQVFPGGTAKAIIINITAQWVSREYSRAMPGFIKLTNDLFGQEQSVFITEPMSFALHHAFRAMHDEEAKYPGDQFFARTHASAIIYDVLAKLLPVHSMENNKTDDLLHARMVAVEQMLNEHLKGQLPGLAEIANSIAVSESTLKRNFKKVYGVGLYEYYLQKKMQLARQLLEDSAMPVKEIAYMLGYEKTSNFIKIFKKYYAQSPGALKKNLV